MSETHTEYDLEWIEMAMGADGCLSPADDGSPGGPREPTIINLWLRAHKVNEDGEYSIDESEEILDIDLPYDYYDLAIDIAAMIQNRVDCANEMGVPFS